ADQEPVEVVGRAAAGGRMKRRSQALAAAAILIGLSLVLVASEQGGRGTIPVHAGEARGPMYPFWAFFGYDEPNYTYMKDGKALLTELAALSPVPVFVR